MTYIYYVLYFVILLILLIHQYLKRPKNLRSTWLKERLGFYPLTDKPHDASTKKIWIHAVSVGEVISCITLINKIKAEVTQVITLSVITDTGRDVAYKKFPADVNIRYLPFDLPFAINRAIKSERPDIFIIIETEIWPGLITCLNNRGVPILILNGRISGKSFNGYKRFRFYFKGIISMITFFGMQSDLYKDRIIEIGALEQRVETIGNFKFDTAPHTKIPDWTKELKGQIIVAGSTHKGEEEIILKAFMQSKKENKNLKLILAPRHPARFREVEDLITALSLTYELRSKGKVDSDIILLDTIGELASVYGASDICILGGSFVPIGGHNLLEPASWGKPVICGRYMDNFPMTDEFVKGGAVWLVDSDTLVEKISMLLSDNALRQKMGSAALELFNKNSGAVDRAVKVIAGL
jgi:3-deoxy-D-manno-octulosonic-acid transferase